MSIKCVFAGNVGRDGELRKLPSGGDVLSFPVATRRAWVNSNGVREEKTTWINCAIFGRRAVVLAPHIIRGAKVFVSDAELTVKRKALPDGFREYWTMTIYDLEFGGSTAPRTGAASPTL